MGTTLQVTHPSHSFPSLLLTPPSVYNVNIWQCPKWQHQVTCLYALYLCMQMCVSVCVCSRACECVYVLNHGPLSHIAYTATPNLPSFFMCSRVQLHPLPTSPFLHPHPRFQVHVHWPFKPHLHFQGHPLFHLHRYIWLSPWTNLLDLHRFSYFSPSCY